MEAEWFDKAGGEAVELRAADPSWPSLAADWGQRILIGLAPVSARMEHVGSTSVPGLDAKPVLDLQVAVSDLNDEASYRPALESLGLVLRQREADHRFFRPPKGEPRSVHIHVCQSGSAWEQEHLRFRDRLRADPDLAASYAALKHRLVVEVGHDRLAYNRGKAEFIAPAVASE